MRKVLVIGSESVTVDADADSSLLGLLREPLGRKSVVRGCSNGECGACRVVLCGELVASCGLRLRDVPEGAHVLTREDVDGEPDVVRTVLAFEAERLTRCRLCVGGLAVTAHQLAGQRGSGEDPSAAIEKALAHATCMCTGRGSLRRALRTSLVPGK